MLQCSQSHHVEMNNKGIFYIITYKTNFCIVVDVEKFQNPQKKTLILNVCY